ncbi:MAG TPA: hypothetical protein PK472_10385 [Pseudomonadota bacterium]|nr:hypothetical protein [Pseudomonadota bacterium]
MALAFHRQWENLSRALRSLGALEVLFAGLLAVAGFAFIGTLTALWQNPFFGRMTAVAGYEYVLLAAQALLGGMYLAVRTPICAAKAAGSGGVLGFLGVACPVCNKWLLAMFGSGVLLTYFEPIRLYVGLFGVAALAWAVWQKLIVRATLASLA